MKQFIISAFVVTALFSTNVRAEESNGSFALEAAKYGWGGTALGVVAGSAFGAVVHRKQPAQYLRTIGRSHYELGGGLAGAIAGTAAFAETDIAQEKMLQESPVRPETSQYNEEE